VQDVCTRRWPGQGQSTEPPASTTLLGEDWIAEVAMVDQSPIGKTTRSNPASYVGAWDAIRQPFRQGAAGAGAWLPAATSASTRDGRCPTCGGNGFEHVEMAVPAYVYLRCADCDGGASGRRC